MTKTNDTAILVMKIDGFAFACESTVKNGTLKLFAGKLLGTTEPEKIRELFELWGPLHSLSKSERANLKNLYSYVYTYDCRLEKWYVSHVDPNTGEAEVGELHWWLTERDAVEPQKTVTEELIKQKIQGCDYIFPPSGKSCVCELTLENGFTVRGESAVVDESHFNADVAKQIAYDSAFNKIWPLEGYLLQEKLYREGKTKNEDK